MCNDILKNITERISKYVFEPVGSVSEDARLIYDLGLSDISAVCMIEELEKKYNIEIPDKAFADIVTVGDVVRAIEASMA